jgi:hypothetical protein
VKVSPIKRCFRIRKKRHFLTKIILINALSLPFGAGHHLAEAASYYFEAGVGQSLIHKSAALFGDSTPAHTSRDLATNFTFAFDLSSPRSFSSVHFGLQHQYASAFKDETFYSFQTVGPIFRIEYYFFYLGAGFSPLVLSSSGNTPQYLYGPTSGAFAATTEAGLVWRVVPFFHILGRAGAQAIRTNDGIGPLPAWNVTFQMRFLYGERKEPPQRRQEHQGWRYPFGIER